MTETGKANKYWCATHGEIDASKAITYETTKGPRAQCPLCKSFLSSTPPSERTQVDAGRQGIIPSKNSVDMVNRYCGKCGNIGQRFRIVPTKTGILNVCEACGSTVVAITDEVLANLPAPPDEESIFPDDPEEWAMSDGAGLDFNDVEAGRLARVLEQSGVPKKRVGFILEVFGQTAAYRNPESLFSFLNSMGLGAARSKIASDYVFSPGMSPNPGMQAVGAARAEDTMEEEIMRAVILRKKLDILGMDAKGAPLQAGQEETGYKRLVQGIELGLKLVGGQEPATLEDEIARVKAIQAIVPTPTENAEVAGIHGRVRLEELKYEREHERELNKQADERAQAARTQETIDGAVKVGMDVVEKLAEPLGATLAGGVKNAMYGQGQQQQQGQGPTPANQLSPEDRAEVIQKIEQARMQLDAREREIQAMDAPSVEMEKVEVMREKDGGHADIHEGGA